MIQVKNPRVRFAEIVRDLGAVWVSNEPPNVFPRIREQAPLSLPPGRFLLAIDGRALAWTAPHGQAIHWFAE